MARIQMDLSEGSMERMKRIKETIEASSYSEVMREALKLYEFLINEHNDDSSFYIKKKDGESIHIKLFY